MREDLEALKNFTYAGRALQAGETFSAPRRDARALRAARRAKPADTYVTTEAKPSVTKIEASAPGKTTAAKKAPAKKAKANSK